MEIVFKNKSIPLLIFLYCFMLGVGIYIFSSSELRDDTVLLRQTAIIIAGLFL